MGHVRCRDVRGAKWSTRTPATSIRNQKPQSKARREDVWRVVDSVVLCCAPCRVGVVGRAHAQAAAAKAHVDAARAAVAPKVADPKAPLPYLQGRCSIRRAPNRSCPTSMRTNDRSAVVPRKEWFAWPANIFDNLYFIGTKTAGVWAINSSDGIIVIDANFHYSSKELVLGLLNFGLDPGRHQVHHRHSCP